MSEHDELAAIIRTHLCTWTLGQVPIEELIELIMYVEQQRREATARKEGARTEPNTATATKTSL